MHSHFACLRVSKTVGWGKCGKLGYLVSRMILTNTLYKTRQISARNCDTDFVSIFFSRYSTILQVHFGFVPISSAACLHEDFSQCLWDNLGIIAKILHLG